MEDDGYMEVPVIDIAPQGDLILVVGSEKLKIRVHSLFMKTASKVFAAMLGPRFTEGQRLAQATPDEPMELELPCDVGLAMKYICAALHFQHNLIPNDLPSFRLIDIALTIDKYELLFALQHQVKSWCLDARKDLPVRSKPFSRVEEADLGYKLAASRYFKDERLYIEAMKAFVLWSNESYQDIFPPHLRTLLTWEIIYGLEVERTRCKLILSNMLIEDEALKLCHPECANCCEWIDQYRLGLRDEIHTKLCTKSWPKLTAGELMDFVVELYWESKHGDDCMRRDDQMETIEMRKFGARCQVNREEGVSELRMELYNHLDNLYWGKNVPLRDIDSDDDLSNEFV